MDGYFVDISVSSMENGHYNFLLLGGW